MKLQTVALAASLVGAVTANSARADCNESVSSNIDPARYQTSGAGTLTDTTTQRMWRRCPVGYAWSDGSPGTCSEIPGEQTTFTWTEALQYAATVGDGWRLPNSKELESLVKRNCWAPAIDTHAFSALPLGFMWTSTPTLAYHGNAWAVQFFDGGIVSVDKEENAYKIRLVKDVQ